jgi:flagellar biosynthetic protein FliO
VTAAFWATYFERLAIVALVLVTLYFLARRLRDSRLFAHAGRRLRVVESAMLTPHAALHIVRVGCQYFLVGSGSAGVTRLAEIEERPNLDAPLGDEGRSLLR